MKKYELTDETKEINGRTLHRIVAARDFGGIKKGIQGGWIEKEATSATKATAGCTTMRWYLKMPRYPIER